jgi:hypothetical protein
MFSSSLSYSNSRTTNLSEFYHESELFTHFNFIIIIQTKSWQNEEFVMIMMMWRGSVQTLTQFTRAFSPSQQQLAAIAAID